MWDITNAHYNENGTIDCAWNHPVLGTIPFTADPNDCEPHGRLIFAQLVAGDYGPVVPFQG